MQAITYMKQIIIQRVSELRPPPTQKSKDMGRSLEQVLTLRRICPILMSNFIVTFKHALCTA
jgi:hypothetical protein